MHEDATIERRHDDDHTRKLVKMVVHEIFESVGADLSTHEGRDNIRENARWVTDWRESTRGVRKGGYLAVGSAMVAGFIWLVMNGVKGLAIALKAMGSP